MVTVGMLVEVKTSTIQTSTIIFTATLANKEILGMYFIYDVTFKFKIQRLSITLPLDDDDENDGL